MPVSLPADVIVTRCWLLPSTPGPNGEDVPKVPLSWNSPVNAAGACASAIEVVPKALVKLNWTTEGRDMVSSPVRNRHGASRRRVRRPRPLLVRYKSSQGGGVSQLEGGQFRGHIPPILKPAEAVFHRNYG